MAARGRASRGQVGRRSEVKRWNAICGEQTKQDGRVILNEVKDLVSDARSFTSFRMTGPRSRVAYSPPSAPSPQRRRQLPARRGFLPRRRAGGGRGGGGLAGGLERLGAGQVGLGPQLEHVL